MPPQQFSNTVMAPSMQSFQGSPMPSNAPMTPQMSNNLHPQLNQMPNTPMMPSPSGYAPSPSGMIPSPHNPNLMGQRPPASVLSEPSPISLNTPGNCELIDRTLQCL